MNTSCGPAAHRGTPVRLSYRSRNMPDLQEERYDLYGVVDRFQNAVSKLRVR